MTPLPILQYLHPFYVASDLPELDDAFEDGKARAIRSLERQIAQIKDATRADYERAFCGRQRAKAEAEANEYEAQFNAARERHAALHQRKENGHE